MTSAERQRLFRLRHPNHYKELRARKKAQLAAMAAATRAAQQESVAASQPLLLPAPVVVIELPMVPVAPALLVPDADAGRR
jgi:hypothetical protein